MQHLERMPGAERLESGASRVVVPRLDLDLGVRTVSDLLVGVEDRRLVARISGRRKANGHALREERLVVGSGQEVPPAPPDDAVTRSGTVARTSFSEPPRGHQNSSASALSTQSAPCSVGGEPRHPRHPLVLAHVVTFLAEEPQASGALVPLEDLGRAVARGLSVAIDEIDARVQVVRDLGVDDVRLVARRAGS